MANTWLTIPCAPNYEIDSYLRVRVKKTGQLLKLQVVPRRRSYYSLRDKSHPYTIKRSPRTLRAQAEEAVKPKTSFVPIPSLGGKYEINIHGKVRNAFSKLIIKPFEGRVVVFDGKKYTNRSVKDLLWEVHGKEYRPRLRACPCVASTSCFRKKFPTLAACAQFIAPQVYRTVGTVREHLHKREQNVFGFDITYLPRKEYSS